MCRTSYRNPVFAGYLADPFVFRHDDAYWAVGTDPFAAATSAESHATIFPVLRSSDLASWVSVGRALIAPDASLGDTFWAPEVLFHEGSFHLYYSVGFDDRLHHLRVATSKNPDGPYRDAGVALTDPRECPFAIDPHPFRDRDGRLYLFHARDFLDSDERASVRAGTALVVAELETVTRLSPRVDTVLRAHFDWQRFLRNRPMYGTLYDWHTLEGPCVREHEGRYYCFYSGGRWQSADYGVDYAVSANVCGPYADDGGARGPRVLKSSADGLLGPGHNSVVLGPDGHTEFLAYHAWDSQYSARRLCIDPLVWTAEGPRCDGPTTTPRPLCTKTL